MGVARFGAQAQLALRDTGEIEQVVDQARFEGDVAFHHSQVFARVSGQALVFAERAGHHQHGRERRAQLVGERGEKSVLRPASRFGAALGRLEIVNVGIGPKPLHDGVTCVARGLRTDEKPAMMPIMPSKTKLDFVALTTGQGSLPMAQRDRQVVGVNQLRPGIAENLGLEVGIEILDTLLVGPIQLAVGARRPDLKRNNFSEKMEPVRGV